MLRRSAIILATLRKELFPSHSQESFAELVGLSRETIQRQEAGRAKISFSHLERFQQRLQAPKGKAARFANFLDQLEAAIREELLEESGGGADAGAKPEAGEAAEPEGRLPEEQRDLPGVAEWFKRTEELFQAAQAWWNQEAPKLDETVRQVLAMEQRIEQLFKDIRAWWEEERKQVEQGLREVADAGARLEQLLVNVMALVQQQEESARVAKQDAERAERARRAQEERIRRWALVAVLAALVAVVGAVLPQVKHLNWGVDSRSTASVPKTQESGSPKYTEKEDGGSPQEDGPPKESEDVLSSGWDAGTAVANLVRHASPLPPGGVPGQLHAPCPSGAEELRDYCWNKWLMTPEQVQNGACNNPNLYEPSEGWCVAHRAAYLPLLSPRKRNAEQK